MARGQQEAHGRGGATSGVVYWSVYLATKCLGLGLLSHSDHPDRRVRTFSMENGMIASSNISSLPFPSLHKKKTVVPANVSSVPPACFGLYLPGGAVAYALTLP